MYKYKLMILAVISFISSGCVEMQTKQQAYPAMYTNQKPVSMVVVPAINETTAADAGELLNVTISQPFANHGYYVMPIPIVADIWKSEGVLEGDQLKGLPTSIFLDTFGADSVLFLTITEWDTNYVVIAANVTVGLEYVLLSTRTNEVLWSYSEKIVIDTGSSSGNILVDVIATAVSTAMTDYVPIASSVHQEAVKALPFGVYHPKSGNDGVEKTVVSSSKEVALQ